MGKNNEELNIINYALMKKRTDALDQKIDDAIVGVFTNGGSVAFENLPALSLDKVGWAYQITDDFTTTSDFVEGAGKDYPAGTFVSIANTGTDASPVLKYNAMLGVIIVDTALSTTSKNAVENRVITTDLLTRLQKVSAMPQNPSNNDLVLWQGDSTYTLGHVYKYVVTIGIPLYAWEISDPGEAYDGVVIYTDSATPATEDVIFKLDGTQYYEEDDPSYAYISFDSENNTITVEIFSGETSLGEKTALRKSADDTNAVQTKWTDVTAYITAGQKSGTTLGDRATAEGIDTTSSGLASHAEGYRTTASGDNTHSEGYVTTASGQSSHSEGSDTVASGNYSHSEGAQTTASGLYAHSEGVHTTASGDISHASGEHTIAQRKSQTVIGKYNVADTEGSNVHSDGKYAFIVGNGTSNARSNAMTVDWDGNLEVSGEVEDGNGEKISDKTDKVENATSGHLAGLDSNGNLTDSGVSPTEDVTVEGNPVTFDSPFEQDAKSVVVTVKPIQDLHGYDHPWVGGAGKNKWNYGDITAETESDVPLSLSAGTYTFSGVKSTNNIALSIRFNYIDETSKLCYDINVNGETITLDKDVVSFNFSVAGFSSGDTITNIMIEVGSTATSFAPYSNECPISGIDEVEIGVSGKNLCPIDNSSFTSNESWVDLEGDAAGAYRGTKLTLFAGTYFVKLHDTVNVLDMQVYNQVTENLDIADLNGGMVTLPSDGDIYIRVKATVGSQTSFKTQVERGSTPTEFEPYVSHTTTIPLPSTLYDADVDVTEGSGNSTHAIVDLSTLTWAVNSTGADYIEYKATISDKAHGVNNYISDSFGVGDGLFELEGRANTSLISVKIPKTVATNLTEFNAWLSNLNPYICYELATPTTISFDPTDVELLEGTNVVSTNAEKVAVTYGRSLWQDIDDLKTDTEGKLDKSDVATIEGDTASRPYSVNEFMLRSDGFYKVTAPIAQNASITASNTTKTTIGAVLTALLNS